MGAMSMDAACVGTQMAVLAEFFIMIVREA
jgi:hypothetical protein